MPNYIKNRIKVTGTKEDTMKLFEEIKSEELGIGTIDFGKITPMPKWVFRENLSTEDEDKIGAENCWYQWCINNWGTKWNAFYQESGFDSENTIEFTTAWSGVPLLIYRLALMFPNVEIDYCFADEDMGYNTGLFKFNGHKSEDNSYKNGSKEAFELAFKLKGVKPEKYCYRFNEESGTYEYDEELEEY